MSKMLKIEDYKHFIENNKKSATEYTSYIEKLLKENIEKELEIIKEQVNKKNFNFLIDNFNMINNNLKLGNVNPKELQLISDKLHLVLNDVDDSLELIYIVLCFYNAYRIYNERFLRLPDRYIKLITNLFISFEQDYDIKKLNNISNFVFNKEIMDELKKISLDDMNMFYTCESFIEAYMSDDIFAPVEYYAKKEIEIIKNLREEEDNYEPSFLGYGIRTPEFIQERLNNQLERMPLIFKTDEYLKTKSDIDMLVYKIKNINKQDQNNFLSFVEKTSSDDTLNPKEKIKIILNYIDSLYYSKLSTDGTQLGKKK